MLGTERYADRPAHAGLPGLSPSVQIVYCVGFHGGWGHGTALATELGIWSGQSCSVALGLQGATRHKVRPSSGKHQSRERDCARRCARVQGLVQSAGPVYWEGEGLTQHAVYTSLECTRRCRMAPFCLVRLSVMHFLETRSLLLWGSSLRFQLQP